jgi:hypothetical protein
VPGGNRFVRGPFARHVFFHRFNRFGFRHHRFRNSRSSALRLPMPHTIMDAGGRSGRDMDGGGSTCATTTATKPEAAAGEPELPPVPAVMLTPWEKPAD